MDPQAIKTGEPFEGLFPVDARTLDAIAKDMEANGYDAAHPVVIWAQKDVVIDGHTRVAAALAAGFDDIPVSYRNFDSEDAAVEYAIHSQRDRRNLSDADLLRWIEEVDKRRKAGRPSGGQNKLTQDCVNKQDHHARASSAETAAVVGTSARKVEQARTVIDKGTDETKEAVKKGEKSINQAYNETVKKEHVPRDPEDVPMDRIEVPEESVALLGLKRYWKRANKKDKQAFREWINEN